MIDLYKAVIKFQAEMKPITKDSVNPHFKSTFADLSSILESVLPVLTRNGLGLLQSMRVDGDRTILQTRIVHISGQETISEIMIPVQSDPQKLGSLITYLKRYSLQALLGIPTEDDDGNSATDYTPKPSNNRADSPTAFTDKKHWAELADLAKAKGVGAPFCKTVAEYTRAKAELMALPNR
jgi:hypothetical protein